MKKKVFIVAIIMAISITAFSGCRMSTDLPARHSSGSSSHSTTKKTPTKKTTTEPKQYSDTVQTETEVRTESRAERPTEPPTEPPTENEKASAYKAYYDYLSNHYDLFNDTSGFDRVYDDHIIAFKDLDYDGVDELVCTRFSDSRQMVTNLCVLSYKNGAIQTLYDDKLFVHAGAEAGYSVFITKDLEMYSVLNQHPHSNVIKYEVTYSGVKAVHMARTEGESTGNPKVDCYIEGNRVSRSEYDSFADNIKSRAMDDLCYSHPNAANKSAADISMSYGEACDYLKNNS